MKYRAKELRLYINDYRLYLNYRLTESVKNQCHDPIVTVGASLTFYMSVFVYFYII